MRFLADMGVDVRLRDEGLHRLPNGEIFSKAAREHRVLAKKAVAKKA